MGLPLNSSKACPVLFEKVDQWLLSRFLKGPHLGPKNMTGISYDDYTRRVRIRAKDSPLSLARDKIKFLPGKTQPERIFSFLVREKFHSLETRILLKRIKFDKKRLERLASRGKNDYFIIPEDSDAARGRLAAIIARKYGIKTLALVPPYYDLITTYPLMGKRIADAWVCGTNYKNRLLRQGINPGKIYSNRNFILKERTSGRPAIEQKILEAVTAGKAFYLATLQNNPGEELFIKMLEEAFCELPDIMVIFKFHPSTARKEKKYLKKKYSRRNIAFFDKIDLRRSLKMSRGLITVSSSSCVSALTCNKPVIFVRQGYFFHQLSGLGNGKILETVFTPGGLKRLISGFENPRRIKQYLLKQSTMKKECFPGNPLED
jgi:hypothetical protein